MLTDSRHQLTSVDEYCAGAVSIEGCVKLIEIDIRVISICGSKPLSSKT